MFENECVPRDAQPILAPPASARRYDPHKSQIWIRIAGTWLPGNIQRWYRLPEGRWGAWLSYQADPEHPTIAPRWGNFAYDPETILDRTRHPQLPDEINPPAARSWVPPRPS